MRCRFAWLRLGSTYLLLPAAPHKASLSSLLEGSHPATELPDTAMSVHEALERAPGTDKDSTI